MDLSLPMLTHQNAAEAAHLLLDVKSDVNALDSKKRTPLMLAAYNGVEPFLDKLIVSGAFLDKQDNLGSTALMYAVMGGHEKIVEKLLNRGAKFDIKNNEGKTALILSAYKGNEECMRQLITAGANLNSLTDKGQSALKIAILADHNKCASLLIKSGADLEISDGWGMTALAFAILKNNFNITYHLLKHHVKITHPMLLEMMIKKHDPSDFRAIACLDALNRQYPDRNSDSLKLKNEASQEIVIIPFMLDADDHYDKLSADEKIEFLAKRIQEVGELLQKQKPDAKTIICWREYGIYDFNSRSISNESRKKLKNTMKAISIKYPNLIIIAGTVLTRKEKTVEDLPKILTYYESLKWLESIEKHQSESKEERHLWLHKNQVQKIQNSHYDKDQKIMVTSNKARVYYHGTEIRHGKVAPYDETKGLGELALYQPGKGNNLNSIIKIDDGLNMAVSICREMQPGFDLVKHAAVKEIPMLHFVLSHTIPLPLSSLCATDAAIHIDSRYDPTWVLPREYKKQNAIINVYTVALDEKIIKLGNRVKPIYPVQFQILDRIDDEICKVSGILERVVLEKIKQTTMNMLSKFYISEEEYKKYIDAIENKKWLLKDELIADIVSIVKKGSVQHTFHLSPIKKMTSYGMEKLPQNIASSTPFFGNQQSIQIDKEVDRVSEYKIS